MLYLDSAEVNSTFSVTTIQTPECIEQQAQLASGGRHSCLRCPIISEETEYDVLFVAEAAGAASAPVHITVRSQDWSPPLQPPPQQQHFALSKFQ